MTSAPRGLAVLIALLGTAVPATAQRVPSPYRFVESNQEAGVFAGVASVGRGRFGYGPGSGLAVGGKYGIDFTGPLALELVSTLFSGTRDIIDPGRDEGQRKVGEADALIGVLDARLKLSLTGKRTWHDLMPYVVFGGGLAMDMGAPDPMEKELPAEVRFDFGNTFVGTLGGGARWFAGDRIGVRVDGVLSLWKLGTPPGFSDPIYGFEAVAESEWVGGLQITLGGSFRF